jgi:hypothetical protein
MFRLSGVAAKDLPQIGDPMPGRKLHRLPYVIRNHLSRLSAFTEPFHLNSDGNLDVTPDVVQSWQHNGFIVVKRTLRDYRHRITTNLFMLLELLSKDELSKITLSLESKGGVL